MASCEHLFVYGTLVSNAIDPMGREPRARLSVESTLIGPASTLGRLFDLGRYPGLVDGFCDGATVHGEVVRLHDAAASLSWLDAYEGIEAPDTAGSEYRRVVRPVTLAGGTPLDAWLYLYVRLPLGLSRIVGGRWLDHVRRS